MRMVRLIQFIQIKCIHVIQQFFKRTAKTEVHQILRMSFDYYSVC